MLTRLTIQNVVLIKSLQIDFGRGLSVLTGETGAGKSILLDALSLALGARSDAGLIRKGADMLSVSATFELPKSHPAHSFLAGSGFIETEELTLRRVVASSGVSKAFINDVSVTAGLLKDVSNYLAEIYSQFAVQELFSPSKHLSMLDTYGELLPDVSKLSAFYRAHRDILKEIEEKKNVLEEAKRQEDYLSHAISELEEFDIKPDEESLLTEKRQRLRHKKQVADALIGAERALSAAGIPSAQKLLSSVAHLMPEKVEAPLAELDSVEAELEEIRHKINDVLLDLESETETPDSIDERFFALKDLYRKYRVSTEEELLSFIQKSHEDLSAISKDEEEIKRLEEQEKKISSDYRDFAFSLRQKRKVSAERLTRGVMAFFPLLKMDKAKFSVHFEEVSGGASGLDQAMFTASMNAGGTLQPVHKVASGGELARLILALKVNLAGVNPYSLLIFDEIDAGVGGATASAVGSLLDKLSAERQVMAITHSPQITAKAKHHLKVVKSEAGGVTLTDISALGEEERIEELARMLSGEKITDEARKAASALVKE